VQGARPTLANLAVIGTWVVGPFIAWRGTALASAGIEPDSTTYGRGGSIVRPLKGAVLANGVFAVCGLVVTVLVMILANELMRGGSEENFLARAVGTFAVIGGVGWTVRNGLVSGRCAELARRSNAGRLRRLFEVMVWVSWAMMVIVLGYGLFALVMDVYQREIFEVLYGARGERSLVVTLVVGAFGIAYAVTAFLAVVWLLAWPLALSALARRLKMVMLVLESGSAVLGVRADARAVNNPST
jgi:hypothetical protein